MGARIPRPDPDSHSTLRNSGKGDALNDLQPDTRIVHGGIHRDEWSTDPLKRSFVNPPIQRASTIMTQVSGLGGMARQLEALRVGSNVEPLGSEFDLISMPLYLNSRATTIYAGSNEVQRDLIARTVGREG